MKKNKNELFIMLALYLVILILLISNGCNASANGIDYKPLYMEQVNINYQLAKQNDSLRLKIIYLNQLVVKVDSIYNIFVQSSFAKIDSLKNQIAFKDSNVIIMLNSIETGLENISDEGLANLIELRKR